ncbi:microsomal glutathione S-transferase 1-like [Glandiceps talaboti]
MVAELTLNNPVFVSFATYGAFVVLKMVALLLLTSIFRIKDKSFVSVEDYTVSGIKDRDYIKKRMSSVNNTVERIRRTVLNDMENIIPFMLLGPLYVLTGPSAATALLVFRIFAGSRVVHTLSYLAGVQPFRALAFFVGISVNFYMGYNVIKNGEF